MSEVEEEYLEEIFEDSDEDTTSSDDELEEIDVPEHRICLKLFPSFLFISFLMKRIEQ